jgi:large subunit ribosomal protein L7Ae
LFTGLNKSKTINNKKGNSFKVNYMAKASYVRFATPAEVVEQIYTVLEKSRAGGKLTKGTNEVTKAIERAQAKLVIIAEDVQPPEVVMHLPVLCEEKKIPYAYAPTKQELGNAAGLSVGSAAIAILDEGEGKELLESIKLKLDEARGVKNG